MRLTKKTNNDPFQTYCSVEKVKKHQLTNKLGQLEDIEEELGVDLITLFKVLKNGIYDKQGNFYYPNLECLDDEYQKEWILIEEQGDHRPDLWFRFKDYGKTWALTKEELEK